MNLSREELIILWQGVQVSIATLRLTIDVNPRAVGKRMRELVKLSDRLQSELRQFDQHSEETRPDHLKSGAV